jgi:hypothetical protein
MPKPRSSNRSSSPNLAFTPFLDQELAHTPMMQQYVSY